MRCYICDKALGDSEIQWSEKYATWDPCSECLQVIAETFGEEGDEEETEVEEPYDDEIFYGDLFPIENNELQEY